MNYNLPDKIRTEIEKCNQCGKCLAVCPTYWVTTDECDSARGLLEMIRNVHNGKLPVSAKYLNHLELCVSCRACTEVCPSNIAINDVFDWAKQQILEVRDQYSVFRKIPYTVPTEIWKEYLSKKSTLKQKKKSFLTSIPEKVGKKNAKQRVGFFVGCLMDIGYQKTAGSIVDWLVAQKYEVIIPKEQECCGMPAILLGAINLVQDKINKNIRIYNGLGIKTIITGCPHCAFMIRNKWNNIIGKVPFNILHIAEVMLKFGVKPILKKNKGMRVGYQPACYLHRGLGLTADVNSLFAKPKLQYVEMKSAVTCCGQAGISGFLFPTIAKEITYRQKEKYAQSKIDCLLTNCPWCSLIYCQQKEMQDKCISVIEYFQGEI